MNRPKILLVEDEPLILDALAFRMKKAGYDTLSAPDGKQAIELVQEQSFDLIITDLMLPFANGFELISYVRETLKSDVPIIVLSVAGVENMIVEALDLGANDFVNKPFSPHELNSRVKRLLRR